MFCIVVEVLLSILFQLSSLFLIYKKIANLPTLVYLHAPFASYSKKWIIPYGIFRIRSLAISSYVNMLCYFFVFRPGTPSPLQGFMSGSAFVPSSKKWLALRHCMLHRMPLKIFLFNDIVGDVEAVRKTEIVLFNLIFSTLRRHWRWMG